MAMDDKAQNTRMFSEDYVNNVKQAAYDQGFTDGRSEKEAQLEIEKRKEIMEKEFLYNLTVEVDKLNSSYQNEYEGLISEVKTLTLTLFQKAFPAYANELCLTDLNVFLESHLKELESLGEVKVFVNNRNVDSLTKRLNNINPNSPNECLKVLGSEDLDLMDCCIKWDSGSLQRKMSNIVNAVKNLNFTPTTTVKNNTGETDV